MMKQRPLVLYLWSASALLLCNLIVCPPVTDKPPESTSLSEEQQEDLNFGLEYERYLKEVVGVLESDDVFRKKLEESNISEIKSGEIARHLDFVGHGIRTKLDEIKRKEVDRLRQMIRLQSAMKKGTNDDDDDSLPDAAADGNRGMKDININLPDLDKSRILAHLDHSNPNSFEIEDLSRLIKQATKDLEDIDVKRKDEFKNYEMEKEHLRKKEMEHLDEVKRAEEQKKFDESKKKHANHPDVHHPGAEAQLKEVWEETDGLNQKDFDPRTFFHLHDTNGDGVLDEPEVEALFQKELDKVYDPDAPEDDMRERYEEMNLMREHVMNEIDKNKDRLISLDEFLESTKNSDFKKDEGWDTLENQTMYSVEELAQFEREYEELQRQQQPSDHLQAIPDAIHHDVNAMQQNEIAVEQQQHPEAEQQPVVQDAQQHHPEVQHQPVIKDAQQHHPEVQHQPVVQDLQNVPHDQVQLHQQPAA